MEIKKYYLTKNKCYINATPISPTGFMLHSTGANNPTLKRYIQPDDGLLGYNKNQNDWNTSVNLSVMVHGFIGKLADGTVAAYQTLPYNYKAWHCGGTGNTTHVSWEMCEDGLDDEKYFNEIYQATVDIAYDFCKEFKQKETCIIDHSEGYDLRIASNHGDVKHWFSRFGKTMDDFRRAVGDKLRSDDLTLKFGSKGELVGQLQTRLNLLGYGLVVDESYGRATMDAVGRFQTSVGLAKTGIADLITQEKLIAKTTFTDIKYGQKGESVKDVQELLNKCGYKVTVDGSYGGITRMNVVNFQSKYKLATTGNVDKITWDKLVEVSSIPIPEKDYVYIKHANGLHTVEIDPLKLKLHMEQTNGKNIKLKNLMNASFVWWADYPKNTKAYPTSVLVYDGKIIRNAQPNGYAYQNKKPSYAQGVPTPVFIIYKTGEVEVKDVNSFTQAEADKIHLAVTGIDLLPSIREQGFSPYVPFSTVAYSTMSVAIGYNPTTKKVVLAYRDKTTASQMSYYMKSVGCKQAIRTDSGGSANFDVEGKNINRTTRAMAAWITW